MSELRLSTKQHLLLRDIAEATAGEEEDFCPCLGTPLTKRWWQTADSLVDRGLAKRVHNDLCGDQGWGGPGCFQYRVTPAGLEALGEVLP